MLLLYILYNWAQISHKTTTLCGTAIDTFKINAFIINSETSPDLTVCRGERVSLSVESTANINWIDTITFQNPNIDQQVVHPHTTQSYYVELNENNCSMSDTITVSVLPVMDQSLDPVYTLNYGENINVNLNANIWSDIKKWQISFFYKI